MKKRDSVKSTSFIIAVLCLILAACAQHAPDTGRPRPREVPSTAPDWHTPRGTLTADEALFTTRKYNREAIRLVLEEANEAARQLGLPEKLPITEGDLQQAYAVPYGLTRFGRRGIGSVWTANYVYFVGIDRRLSGIAHARYNEACNKWRAEYRWPTNRIDTNGAYQLATQWLAAVSMDVDRLNEDCKVLIRPNAYWNSGLIKKRTFVPIYDVHWLTPENQAKGGDVAYVCLFLPTKTLIDLSVRHPKYILRDPILFTNLNELLSEPEERTVAPPE